MSLEEGLVHATCYGPIGEDVGIGLWGRGRPLGTTSTVIDRPSEITVTAVTDCVVSHIDAARFRVRLSTNAALEHALLRLECHHVEERTDYSALMSLPTRCRIEVILALVVSDTAVLDQNQCAVQQRGVLCRQRTASMCGNPFRGGFSCPAMLFLPSWAFWRCSSCCSRRRQVHSRSANRREGSRPW